MTFVLSNLEICITQHFVGYRHFLGILLSNPEEFVIFLRKNLARKALNKLFSCKKKMWVTPEKEILENGYKNRKFRVFSVYLVE